MANLLGKTFEGLLRERSLISFAEVSKGDEIMPAIKTLKLLAHGTSQKTPIEKSKSSRIFPSKSPDVNRTSTGTDSGDA